MLLKFLDSVYSSHALKCHVELIEAKYLFFEEDCFKRTQDHHDDLGSVSLIYIYVGDKIFKNTSIKQKYLYNF